MKLEFSFFFQLYINLYIINVFIIYYQYYQCQDLRKKSNIFIKF